MKQVIWIIPVLALVVSCSDGRSSKKDPTTLAREDIAAMSDFPSQAAYEFDRLNKDRFLQIFGGRQGSDISRYVSDRVHHLLALENTYYSPEDQHVGWLRMKPRPATAKPRPRRMPGPKGSGKIEIMAANLGMQFWYQGLIDQTTKSLLIDDRAVAITSKDAGIMLIGEAYTEALPREFRNEILIHEARHSDCTGGLSTDDIKVARNASYYEDFYKNSKSTTCGHFHSICPDEHDYAGVLACDDKPWGAYSVGFVYAAAVTPSLDVTTESYQLMKALELDAKTRFQFDYDAMIQGRLGDPDMSSSDVYTPTSP